MFCSDTVQSVGWRMQGKWQNGRSIEMGDRKRIGSCCRCYAYFIFFLFESFSEVRLVAVGCVLTVRLVYARVEDVKSWIEYGL